MGVIVLLEHAAENWMFPVTTCGCPQIKACSGDLPESQDLLDQQTVAEGFLDDAEPARSSCNFDQLRGGCVDQQQNRQVGEFIKEYLYQCWTTQAR